MALSPSPSSFNTSFSSPNNNPTTPLPKAAQLSTTIHAGPFCLPPLSTTTSPPITPVVFPSLSFSNILFFKSAYNVQVIAGENEPEEKLVGRFRREVFRAGVIQECKRRRFFETTQEKKKRKNRDAARRNRKRRPQSKSPLHDTQETLKEEVYKSDEDNWDLIDAEVPYT